MHHPYRFMRASRPERPCRTWATYIKHVHIKDSRAWRTASVEYRLMGEGDLPIDEMMRRAALHQLRGLSSPWNGSSAGCPSCSDAGVVLPAVRPLHVRAIPDSSAIGRARAARTTHAGTGKYVWPKETLIDLTFPQVLDRMVEEFPDQYCFRYTTLRLHAHLSASSATTWTRLPAR